MKAIMPHFRRAPSIRFNPVVTALLLTVWVVLMGWLLRERYFPTATSIADGAHIGAAEADDWFLIRIRGASAGFGRSIQFQHDGGWRLRDELNISLNIQGHIKPVRIINESDVDDQFRLIRFDLKVASGLISFDVRGRMEGRDLVLETPGAREGGSKRIKVYETPRIARSLGLPVPLVGLQVGEEIKLPVFDPLDGQKWDAVINVLERADLDISGSKVAAWRVKAGFRAMDVTMWVDSDGRLLKGRMPLDITVIRSDKKEVAREMKGMRDLPEMTSLTSVPVEGSIPENPAIELVRLKVEGKGDWNIPSDGFRQTFKDSEITLKREIRPESTYSLPSVDPAMQQYLEPTPFIQSAGKEIVEKAREIVGAEKDPVRAAELINRWVYSNIKKIPTPSMPDAQSVLVTRQGDCNEHAVLAAALARAVGLPARVVVGLVYSGEEFYYHAWVTYWAGKTWVTGDPLLNLLPVGPTHLALLYGDVDKHVNVISFLGRLKLKVLETR